MSRRFSTCAAKGKLHRATRMIEPLEPRRMLFSANGTSGSDIIEIDYRPVGFLVEYDVTVNGVHRVEVGASGGNSYDINGFGGDDLIVIRRVHSDDFADLDPGPGDDRIDVAIGSFTADVQGHLLVREDPNEGDDRLFVNDGGGGSNEPIRVDKFRIFAGDGEIFHGNPFASIQLRVASVFAQLHEVYVLETPANMTIDMGNRENPGFVTFGNNHVMESSATPMAIVGANLVRIDDSDGPGLRTFDITPDAVFGKTLIDVKAVEFIPRGDNGNAPYTFNITGDPADFIYLRSCAGFVNVGSTAAPVDLEGFDAFIENKVRGSTRLFDQAGSASNNPFLLQTLVLSSTNQSIRKGSFNMTMQDGDIDLEIRESGTNGTVFNISELAVDSTVRVFGGTGGDTLRTTTTPANNHLLDLDNIFVGESFFFDGRQGDNFLELNDINGNTQFGNPTYRLQQGKLVKNLQELLRYNPVNASRIFLAGSSDNDAFFFGGAPGTRVTLNGGAGNDLFSTFDQDLGGGNLPLEGMNATIFGAVGFDAFTIDDTAGSGADRIDVSSTVVSYQVGSVTSTMAYDGIESMQIFQGNGPAATFLNSKLSALQLTVDTGAGNDTVTAGGGDFDANGFLLSNTTVLGGAGSDVIEYQDGNDFASDTYTWNTSVLSRATFGFNAISFETRTLHASNGLTIQALNTINLDACASDTLSTTIFGGGGGAGTSTVNVTQGNLANLFGTLTVDADRLNVNDQNQTGTRNYDVSATQLVWNVLPQGSGTRTVNYSGLSSLVINGSQGGNKKFTVTTTPAGQTTTLNATSSTAGFNAFWLGGGNIAANLLGPVIANASGGASNGVVMDNSLDTSPSTQTINGAFFTDGQTHTTNAASTVVITNGGGGGTINVNRVTTYYEARNNGPATINIGAGNLDANILATFGADSAGIVTLDDRLDTGNDGYVLDAPGGTSFRKTTAGAPTISMAGYGAAILQCNNADNVITVNNCSQDVQVFSNGGNDRFDVLSTKPNFFAPVSTLGIDTGSENTGVSPFGDVVNVSGTSGVQTSNSDTIRNLSVSGSNAKMTVPTGVTAKLQGLALTGTIDLAGGALLSGTGGPSLATLKTLIIRGYNNGAWNGTHASGAINSSLAASSASAHDAVGYGAGSQIALSTIGGFNIGAADTLVRYTWYGDADLNGRVDGADYSRIDSKFNQQGAGAIGGWTNGDFNYNDRLDGGDYALIDAAFNSQTVQLRPEWSPPTLPRQGGVVHV